MKNKLFIVSIVIVLAMAGVFWGLGKLTETPKNTAASSPAVSSASGFNMMPKDNAILIKPHAAVKGPLTAKVTVVEFLDPECESCGAMSPIVKRILSEHADDVKLVVRYMSYHKNSKFVANILEGAKAQNKYWEALELLFSTQDAWASHHDPKPELIPEILAPLKLDMKKILADAKAGKYDALIDEDMEDGKKLGVRGTPTFFINGHELESLGYDSLKQAITNKL
jgi:protein-disulfide isomerase